jgi:hypothetical protein
VWALGATTVQPIKGRHDDGEAGLWRPVESGDAVGAG